VSVILILLEITAGKKTPTPTPGSPGLASQSLNPGVEYRGPGLETLL